MHHENYSQTIHSVPQTGMNEDIISGEDNTENSVGNLFNNAQLNKKKLPPLEET